MTTGLNKQYNNGDVKNMEKSFSEATENFSSNCTWNGQSYTACWLKHGLLYKSYIFKFILGVNIDAQNMQCTQKTIQYMFFVSIGNLRWPKWFNMSWDPYFATLKVMFLFFDLWVMCNVE